MKVVLIPCAPTEWHDEGRLLGRTELPLTTEGADRCSEWSSTLRLHSIQKIYHSPDELATQTAGLIANPLGVPVKPLDALEEIDVGLWAGLTERELKTRFASAHRELCEAPLNVHPPSGERVGDAASRLKTCLRKRVKPNGKATIGLVLRPLSFAVARCTLESGELSRVWEVAQRATDPIVIEYHGAPAAADARS
jgi:broad specificity phosphatase PhoE